MTDAAQSSASEILAKPASPKATTFGWRPVFAVWALLGALMVVYALAKPDGIPLFGDNAMRMVMVQDLLNGQAWQDLTQYRDNAPYGASMHWSRLIDAPIAALVLLMRPFAGPAAMEVATLVWPFLLTLPFLALTAAITRRLVPESDTTTALALPVISIVLIVEFLPGSVDHHSAQMVLTLLVTWMLLTARHRIGGAVVAGLASATSLAIGMETLPFVAATIAIYGLLWLFQPREMARALAWFGLSFATGTLAHFIVATPPSDYLVPACDMLTISYVVPILAGGAGLLGVAVLGSTLASPLHRGVVLTLAGGATLLVFILFSADCLAGPYGAEELAIPGYFEQILEAQPLLLAFAENPANTILFAATTFIGLTLTVWRTIIARGEQRIDWLIQLGFLLVAVAVLFLQLRGVRFTTMFIIPAGAWLIAMARTFFEKRPKAGRAGLLVGAWLLVSSTGHYAVLAVIAPFMPRAAYASVILEELERKQDCIAESTYAQLRALPSGRVMAPFNLGTNILLYTPHETVSAGFHRNIVGTTEVSLFFTGDETVARRIADERSIDYVAVCAGIKEYDGTIGPDAMTHWSWLMPISPPDEPLQLYRVTL